MRAIRLIAALIAFAIPLFGGHVFAVGLGPLKNQGITGSDRKGFYLTLMNPYRKVESFHLYPIALADDTPEPRVKILPAETRLAPEGRRRILVVAKDLAPGETRSFRVCAERTAQPGEVIVHARVCSKLTARRIN